MKLGLGLYTSMLTPDPFRFAKQAGATHIVAPLVDYFATSERLSTASGVEPWRQTRAPLWTKQDLQDLKRAVDAEGLELEAIEDFDPAHWYDVLLDAPRKAAQLETLKQDIRDMGQVGICVMGYCFTPTGASGRHESTSARGGARCVAYTGQSEDSPISRGTVWNMVYAPETSAPPTPLPWHAGMAYALGWMKGALMALQIA